MDKSDSPKLLLLSKIISNFFNPLVSLLIYFGWSSIGNSSLKEVLHQLIPLLLIIILPITIWIFWKVKNGTYTNMDVSDRNQRKSLYLFVAVSIVAYLLYDYFVHDRIDWIVLFILILLFALQISNLFIKSSMHTAFNVFVAALFFVKSPVLGCIWLVIAILVGITRVILKRHTVKEVLMGTFIASLVSFIYFYTNIQLHH